MKNIDEIYSSEEYNLYVKGKLDDWLYDWLGGKFKNHTIKYKDFDIMLGDIIHCFIVDYIEIDNDFDISTMGISINTIPHYYTESIIEIAALTSKYTYIELLDVLDEANAVNNYDSIYKKLIRKYPDGDLPSTPHNILIETMIDIKDIINEFLEEEMCDIWDEYYTNEELMLEAEI